MKNIFLDEKNYKFKINYKFHKSPFFKYKSKITRTNYSGGANDIFEVYLSYKDNKEYIASPNTKTSNIDIFILLGNKKLNSLVGHKNDIRTVRYFINYKNNNEYLISADTKKIVIVWDITNNYKLKHYLKTLYYDDISSCLLFFPPNINEDYIITSSNSIGNDVETSAAKIYSLNNGKYIKYISNSNNYYICYLLSWYNKENNKYYLVELAYQNIIINNLLEDEFYCQLKHEPEGFHNSGFIYNKGNSKYLCCLTTNGYINIWDLYNKNLFKAININGSFLMHIINWNNKYIVVSDIENNSAKIIDIESDQVISIIKPNNKVVSAKKLYHPIYGESLLIAARDHTIKLWII